jgi:hypothetical protein
MNKQDASWRRLRSCIVVPSMDFGAYGIRQRWGTTFLSSNQSSELLSFDLFSNRSTMWLLEAFNAIKATWVHGRVMVMCSRMLEKSLEQAVRPVASFSVGESEACITWVQGSLLALISQTARAIDESLLSYRAFTSSHMNLAGSESASVSSWTLTWQDSSTTLDSGTGWYNCVAGES